MHYYIHPVTGRIKDSREESVEDIYINLLEPWEFYSGEHSKYRNTFNLQTRSWIIPVPGLDETITVPVPEELWEQVLTYQIYKEL